MYPTLTHLTDDEIAELECSYLYSTARNIEGKSFEDYVNEVRPFVDDNPAEGSVEQEREGYYDFMLRKYREEQQEITERKEAREVEKLINNMEKHMGKKNYVEEMQKFMAEHTPENADEVQAADEREMYVSGGHYNDVVPGFQYMEMMQYMLDGKQGVESHLFGQIYKYLMRAGKKDDYEQDLRKATWYAICLTKYVNTGMVSCHDNDIIKVMEELEEARVRLDDNCWKD